MAKLVDIAKVAQVSNAAVSYAFSSDPAKRAKLSPETMERILRTAAKFNYRPSLTGRGFALRRSYNIALLMPISCTRNMSAHYLGMFHGVSSGIAGSDYNLSVFFGCDEKFFGSVKSGRIDAVAVLARRGESEIFKKLAELTVPIVFLNRPAPSECVNAAGCYSDYRGWLTGVLEDFSRRGVKNCKLYYREDRYGDEEARRLFGKLCGDYSLHGQSFPRQEFAEPGELGHEDGFIFCGSSPAILDFICRHQDMNYVILSEIDSYRRNHIPPAKLFHHDSEAVGRVGVEMLLSILERGILPKGKSIPLIRCEHAAERPSLIPEF